MVLSRAERHETFVGYITDMQISLSELARLLSTLTGATVTKQQCKDWSSMRTAVPSDILELTAKIYQIYGNLVGVFLRLEAKDKPKSLGPLEQYMHEVGVSEIIKRIESLKDDNQYYVIESLIGYDCEPLSMLEISHELGISRERVRQIRNMAIDNMRKVV